ncbi:hypothetical protein MPSEU_001044700 [Mayamaea pseudoterrestris]|nr:hypothetical protein MPSEU_001044700 [Mayamaea pseudoterrestris]
MTSTSNDCSPVSPDEEQSITLNISRVADECPDIKCLGFDDYDVMRSEQKEILEQGGALFSLDCTHKLDATQALMVNEIVNLSSFDDEARDNHVPKYVHGEDSYPFMLVKVVYLLPFPDFIDWITPEKLASTSYQSKCQLSSHILWEQDRADTFRFTKPIIPLVFKMTVQFRVSELARDTLDALAACIGGISISKGMLLERTKRSSHSKSDRCLKVKSVLLYTEVNGGLLCHHLTVIMLASVPKFVTTVVKQYKSLGSNETSETISNTRKYLRSVFSKTS